MKCKFNTSIFLKYCQYFPEVEVGLTVSFFLKCICAQYLDVLEENSIIPIVVLDGRKLEEKIVNESRARYLHNFRAQSLLGLTWSDGVVLLFVNGSSYVIVIQYLNCSFLKNMQGTKRKPSHQLKVMEGNRRDDARPFLKQRANVSTKMALELIEV